MIGNSRNNRFEDAACVVAPFHRGECTSDERPAPAPAPSRPFRCGTARLNFFGRIGTGADQISGDKFWRALQACKDRDVLQIHFDSPGGAVAHQKQIIDFLKTCGAQSVGINVGECCSAALAIFLNCTHRFATPGAVFMIHSTRSADPARPMSEDDRRAANKKIVKLLRKKTRLTKGQAKRAVENELYLTAAEARELGIIDNIVSDRCSPERSGRSFDLSGKPRLCDLDRMRKPRKAKKNKKGKARKPDRDTSWMPGNRLPIAMPTLPRGAMIMVSPTQVEDLLTKISR